VVVAAGLAGVSLMGCGNVGSPPAIDAAPPTPDDGPTAIDAMPDASVDAPVDAPIDAPPRHKYDVGYINEITLAPNNRVLLGFILVANIDSMPLQATDATVVSFADSSPVVEWEFIKDQDAVMPIAPSRSAGLLSPAATEKIVTSGLVTEPNDDMFMSFAMSFVQTPPAGITFDAQAVLRIAGENVTLQFKIHTMNTTMITFHSARRVSSTP
jgi:hypothetical protein